MEKLGEEDPHRPAQHAIRSAGSAPAVDVTSTLRTAVYGSVRTVVWEGPAGTNPAASTRWWPGLHRPAVAARRRWVRPGVIGSISAVRGPAAARAARDRLWRRGQGPGRAIGARLDLCRARLPSAALLGGLSNSPGLRRLAAETQLADGARTASCRKDIASFLAWPCPGQHPECEAQSL